MFIYIGLIIFVGLIFVFVKKGIFKTSTKINDKDENEELFNVSSNDLDSESIKITIELNENELIKRINAGTLSVGQTKKIENIEDITGFYGTLKYSCNKTYCVSCCDGYYNNEKWEFGNLALVKGKTLLFKKKIERPHDCYVSNDGVVTCCDWLNTDELAGSFQIFNAKGELLFAKNTTANLGTCAISENSKIAIFETFNSKTEDADKIFVVDIIQKKIINKFQRQKAFNEAIIDTTNNTIKLIDHRGFTFEIDFNGNQTNTNNYEMEVLTKGSVYDCLCVFAEKPDDIKYNDKRYLDILKKALSDTDSLYSFGKDKIYKMIGEYYDANGDIAKTIENWEKAIQINPRSGLNRKLETLKKKL